jgi:hypothetical protein
MKMGKGVMKSGFWPQKSQEMDTVLSRGLSFGLSLGEAIDKAVSQAATKIPPSSVPALAVILFSSEYSEQGYVISLGVLSMLQFLD